MADEDDQATGPAHHTGTRKGEQMPSDANKEPGRRDTGTNPAGRPTGKSTPRFSTGINADAENPIDPKSPYLPPA
jgi:hypothetical protein